MLVHGHHPVARAARLRGELGRGRGEKAAPRKHPALQVGEERLGECPHAAQARG
jgi:hypothetical protein